MARFQVVYLTGAPASGKSTLCANLERQRSDIRVFSYSQQLRLHVAQRTGENSATEEEIRQKSSLLVRRADVGAVDEKLIEVLHSCRGQRHVIIDSHPVTKEHYGFRVTPFTSEQLRRVAPTLIVVLFASAEEALARIKADSQGRPTPSAFEADFHTHLQAAVAFAYAFQLGSRVHYLDASMDQQAVVAQVCCWLDQD